MSARVRGGATLAALTGLYLAQGIPFGFATEYLPVVLRASGVGYAGIAALGWLQLPWQLKIFWARAADAPWARRRTRSVILAMQLALTLTVAAFALRSFAAAPLLWYVLTFVAAAFAATQDVFVDAFAVRVLSPEERGYGNTAQVAGYRLGILVGGAALLLVVERLGERATLLACAGIIALASVGAFVASTVREEAREPSYRENASPPPDPAAPSRLATLARHLVAPGARNVLLVALTFKLGLHMAGVLIKPMAYDHGWTKQQIGAAVVTVGTASSLFGAAAGGVLHRIAREKRALLVALFFQALVCAPLFVVDRLRAPLGFTTATIALEHFGSGLGTTVLFAALMSATRPSDAGLHYTVLTSANALAIGLGGMLGGTLASALGTGPTFLIATLTCLAPAPLLLRWNTAAEASRS